MKLDVLVTGGAGFIGSALTRQLHLLGNRVTVLDDFSGSSSEFIESSPYEFLVGSVADSDWMNKSLEGRSFDFVFHLAARGSVPRSIANPVKTIESNFLGTMNVLQFCLKKKTPILFSSSSSVYGVNPKIPKTELDWCEPKSPYAASKLASEGLVQSYHHSFELPTQVFRFFNVFGPGQRYDHEYAAVIPKWIKSCLKEEDLILEGDGEQSRDFTYIDDLVKVLIISAQEKRSIGKIVNFAFGHETKLNSIIELLKRDFPKLSVRKSPDRKGDVPRSCSDPKLLKEIYPEAIETPFEDALSKTVEWLRHELKVSK